MRVAIDAQLAVGSATGIGEYVRGLTTGLRALGIDVVALDAPRLDPWRFDRRVIWDQWMLPRSASRAHAELLHCASGTMPLLCSLPTIVTVHDVAWLRVQEHTSWYARAYFGRFSLARYRGAAAIVTDSEFSRRELLAMQPSLNPHRVHTVSPGVAPDVASIGRGPGDRRTILVVGTIEFRKNLEHLIRLLPSLLSARIVSVGPATPYLEACRVLARSLGVEERIAFRGYIPRDELLALYATCAVAAVPSRYEGFGYAVAQALCAGVPCVASNCASLPEVAGNDARLVPLDDEQGWITALSHALAGEEDARAALIRPRCIDRFSWQTAASRMADIYKTFIS